MKKKSILLVEDDGAVRELIREFISRDYVILEASDYSEAINHSGNKIDLALIDYSLPGKDGFELLKKLRDKKPSIPAIIMTAYGSENVAIKAVRADATDYIKKPLGLAYLKKRISEIFDGKACSESYEIEGVGFEKPTRDEFIMDGIASYIDDNYMEGLTLDKISSLGRMNRFKFCRIFKKRFGVSYTAYLNNVRIRDAADLLKNTDRNITEIAHHVGFNCVTYFERVFKSKYGLSPSAYRKKRK